MKIKRCMMLVIAALFFLCGMSFAQEQESELIPQDKEPQAQAAAAPSNTISLDIKGMDVLDVLKMLATRAGMNIVVGKNVTGKVSLFLKNVDVQDAFDIILLSNDLACDRKGDIINVMTQRDYELIYGERYEDIKHAATIRTQYAKAADISRALNQIKSNVGRVVVDEGSNTISLLDTKEKIREMVEFIKKTDLPLESRVFTLNYGQADKILPKLQEVITKGVGSIRIDERTNKVAVTDYPQRIAEIAKLVSAFDERPGQVLIDAQIIEINPSDEFQMGVDWDFFIRKHLEIAASLPVTPTGGLSFGTSPTATVSQPGDYSTIVKLLRTIGDTKILSSPRILALNNQESRILVGKKDAYITSATSQTGTTAVTSQSVNFVDTGIKLYVTPTINRDGFVTMKIRPEISSAETVDLKAADQVTQVPIVSTSEAETTVMIKDGRTIIIGGLKRDERDKNVAKIPILGDLPWIGALFRNVTDSTTRSELVILLTPHLISGESPYTDIDEIKPKQGAVVSLVNGEILTDKYPASVPVVPALSRKAEAPREEIADSDYYRIISRMINQSANLNFPTGSKGKVDVNFSVDAEGRLTDEPMILSVTDSALTPFAIKTIKDASPFPPFPKAFGKDKESFKISLMYE